METNISMQQLKQQRLTPAEKFVLDKIKGAKASEPDEYGNITWCDKDGNWLFKQCFKHGYLLLNGPNIRWGLGEAFNLHSSEIKQLLTKLLHKYTNNGQLKISV
jgi:hypothetical protein